ncbi:MAG: DNA-binding response regulator [Cohnella sp.]|nr:DNA-binding response regulator [Cohnella sp.]
MFEERYEAWLAGQRKMRKGESLRRLNEGHGVNERLFAETIWWPAIGNFEFLQAEYEVSNFRGGCYYLDHACIRHPYLIDWEVDDFSSHAKNMNRREFEYERQRQNELILSGWQVYRIPLDAIKERPKQVQQFVLQVMGKLYGIGSRDQPALPLKQREIIRLGLRLQRPFTPLEASEWIGVSDRYARELLRELIQQGLLEAAGGSSRIRSYRLTQRGARTYLP